MGEKLNDGLKEQNTCIFIFLYVILFENVAAAGTY